MARPWVVEVAQRTHPAFLPVVWLIVSLAYFYAVISFSEGQSKGWESREQLIGGALVYCLLTAYAWFCGFYQWQHTSRTLDDLAGLLPVPVTSKVPDYWFRRVQCPPAMYILSWALVAGLYGLSQNAFLISDMRQSGNIWLDVSMILANVIMFMNVGALLGRRLYAHTGLMKAGFTAKIDLYNLHSLWPFASVGLFDVLVTMGAVALLPIQALDAEFRWVNYEAAVVISIPAAFAFFVLPMWGVHRSIRAAQVERVVELQTRVNECDRGDISTLETLVAHRDRVQSIRTWPLDMRLISRAIFYLVIPPLAWIGAALVEKLVEGIIG